MKKLQTNRPTDYTEQPDELVRGSFLLVKFKGRNSCMILDYRQDTENKCKMMGKAFNPTMYTCDLLTLFYHESFHRYVQDGKNRWTNPKNTSGQAPLGANNLTLTNIKTVEPIKHKIEGVTINGTATLSDCTPSETVTVQNLPIDVKIGKDSFGNTIYFLQNN